MDLMISRLPYRVVRIGAIVSLLLTLVGARLLLARLIEPWTYKEMFDKADLVAIAYVISTKDTEERTTLLGSIKVVGVTTEFKSALVLKGPESVRIFQVHHYRYQSESDRENITNAPDLVRIGSYHPVFLLFLVKEPDGRYVPVTGQTDPAMFSMLKLDGAALGDFDGPPPQRHNGNH
jgi:hypothetical protein